LYFAPSRNRRTASTLIFGALAGALCVLVVAQPAFPSQDGPLHLYYAHVLHDLLAHKASWCDYYVVRPGIPPYLLQDTILLAAQMFASPLLSEQILVVACVLLLCLGFRYAVLSLRPDATWSTLFIFPVALHKSLYMGFYNFSLGLGMMLLLCGYWLRRRRRFAVSHALLFASGAWLLAFTHPVALVLTLGFAILERGLRMAHDWRSAPTRTAAGSRRSWMAGDSWRLVALAAASTTLVYIAAYTSGSRLPEPPDLRAGANHLGSTLDAIWPMRTTAQQIIRTVLTGGAVALALLNRRRSRAQRAVLGYTIICAGIYVIAPNNVNGGDYFHERFAIASFLFLVLYCASLDFKPRIAARLGLAAAALALLLAGDQFIRLRPFAEQAAQLDSVRVTRPGSQGLVLAGRRGIGPSEFNFSPCIHVAAHYFRRADAVLVNSSWLHMPITAITPRTYEPYHYLDPQFMTAYGLRHPERLPRADFIVAVECPADAADPELARLIQSYSAGAAPELRSGSVAVYNVRPELTARWPPRDMFAGTNRP
jgi:hypothetical protein